MQDYQHQWIASNKLSEGEHLKTPDGSLAVADGGTTPKDHEGWMWDLTVPGNNDHDFYVVPAITTRAASLTTYDVEGGNTPVLVHNCGGEVVGHPSDCTCADGGVPKVCNGALAGGAHPKTGVTFDENGFPDFSD